MATWQDDNGGRTHEPSLREVTAEMDGLKELMEERDRRYEDRFNAQQKAVEAALAAAEKQTLAAFNSGEKAIAKQEAAQTSYNERTNEFRGQLFDQARLFMPRSEAEAGVKQVSSELDRLREDARRENEGIKKEIASLRETRSAVEAGSTKSKDNIAMVISIISTIISFFAAGLIITRGTP